MQQKLPWVIAGVSVVGLCIALVFNFSGDSDTDARPPAPVPKPVAPPPPPVVDRSFEEAVAKTSAKFKIDEKARKHFAKNDSSAVRRVLVHEEKKLSDSPKIKYFKKSRYSRASKNEKHWFSIDEVDHRI